jgi:hypothetical protein
MDLNEAILLSENHLSESQTMPLIQSSAYSNVTKNKTTWQISQKLIMVTKFEE